LALLRALTAPLIGVAEAVPAQLLHLFPELEALRLRRGGILPRIGGWFLGQRWVDGITLGRRVWLSPVAVPAAELLLHELRHVRQFQAVSAFPFRYCWESLRHGYSHNRYELDARRFVAARLAGTNLPFPHDEG
jgi:hypothetical protein